MRFLGATPSSALYCSVLSLGELRKGTAIKARADAEGARQLVLWLNGLQGSFGDHILPVDAAVAQLWGEMSADRSRPVVDTLLAATAVVNNLVLVTRNLSDMRGLNVETLNPWA
jgi:predicted nucleic acid-binding protein